MTDTKSLLGQIEFLKECNARLNDKNNSIRFKNGILTRTNAQLVAQIESQMAEIARLNTILETKNAEIRKLHQSLEVIREYNHRLNDKVNVLRNSNVKEY